MIRGIAKWQYMPCAMCRAITHSLTRRAHACADVCVQERVHAHGCMRTDACTCTCTHGVGMASQIQWQSWPHLPWWPWPRHAWLPWLPQMCLPDGHPTTERPQAVLPRARQSRAMLPWTRQPPLLLPPAMLHPLLLLHHRRLRPHVLLLCVIGTANLLPTLLLRPSTVCTDFLTMPKPLS